MKIFLSTAPRFKKNFGKELEQIYRSIEKLGHTHVDDYIIRVSERDFYTHDENNIPKYYDQLIVDIKKSDVVIFEGSFPSTGIGHLLDTALYLGKSVIVLYTKDHFPFLLGGIRNERLVIIEYSIDSLEETLKTSLDYLSEKTNVRFNFFVSPEIQQYLDWVAKYKRTPRAVYLRELLERDMKENKDWKKQK